MRAALTALLTAVLLAVAAPAGADTVRLPTIGASAPVVPVAVGGGGALNTGHNLFAAYRWDRGVRPCAPGSFALVIHAYDVPGGRALGNELHRLGRGDRVGFARCTYRVTSSTVMTAAASVRAGCDDFDGRARGCLITCVNRLGPGRYSHRLVIRIVKDH